MDFYEAEQKLVQFSTQLRSGQITPAQFADAMQTRGPRLIEAVLDV